MRKKEERVANSEESLTLDCDEALAYELHCVKREGLTLNEHHVQAVEPHR